MSETTNSPEPDDARGTFVGGSFGRPRAEQQDDQEAVQAFRTAEGLEDTSDADVEGVSDGVAPGERNEPV